MKTINCPRCSATLNAKQSMVVNCTHCGSSFVLENNTTNSPISLKQYLTIDNQTYHVISQNSQNHNDGTRVDWLITDSQDNKKTLMIDDENMALVDAIQVPLKSNAKLNWMSLLPNTQCRLLDENWLVTDKKYFNKSQKQTYLGNQAAELLILTFTPQQTLIQKGKWLDIFEVLYEN